MTGTPWHAVRFLGSQCRTGHRGSTLVWRTYYIFRLKLLNWCALYKPLLHNLLHRLWRNLEGLSVSPPPNAKTLCTIHKPLADNPALTALRWNDAHSQEQAAQSKQVSHWVMPYVTSCISESLLHGPFNCWNTTHSPKSLQHRTMLWLVWLESPSTPKDMLLSEHQIQDSHKYNADMSSALSASF